MFALQLKEGDQENTKPNPQANPISEADSERNHILNLITGLDLDDSQYADESRNTANALDKPLHFSFDLNEPVKKAPKASEPPPAPAPQLHAVQHAPPPQPLPVMQSAPVSDDSTNVLSQLKLFADEVHAGGDYNSLSATDLSALSDNDGQLKITGEEPPFVAYLQTLQASQRPVDDREFLLGQTSNGIAIAKAIDGLLYINQPAAEHIYSLAVIEIYNGQFSFAKECLLFICDASTDQKYVGMALDLLQSNALCAKQEFISIVKDVIAKEELLKTKISQL